MSEENIECSDCINEGTKDYMIICANDNCKKILCSECENSCDNCGDVFCIDCLLETDSGDHICQKCCDNLKEN